jgi:hypothetical protein
LLTSVDKALSWLRNFVLGEQSSSSLSQRHQAASFAHLQTVERQTV